MSVLEDTVVVTSTNGTTWLRRFWRPQDDFTSITYGDGRFVAVDAGEDRDVLVRQTRQESAGPAVAGWAVLRRLVALPAAMPFETLEKKRLVRLDDAAQARRLRRRERGEQTEAPAPRREAADGHVGAVDDL